MSADTSIGPAESAPIGIGTPGTAPLNGEVDAQNANEFDMLNGLAGAETKPFARPSALPVRGGKPIRSSAEVRTMPISELSAVERVARVLAAERLSMNAEGYEASAGDEVDAEWHLYLGQAVAVLRTLREPDTVMADAGDCEVWRRMIEAALEDFEGDPVRD